MSELLTRVFAALFYSAFISVMFTGWLGYFAFSIIGSFFGSTEQFNMIGFAIAWLITFSYFFEEEVSKESKMEISHLNHTVNKINKEKEEIQQTSLDRINEIEQEKDIYKTSLLEKSTGFPTLLSVIEAFDAVKDREVEDYLRYKKHPSVKSSEIVKEYNHKRRLAEFEQKKTQLLIEYYESLAPFLIDYKNEIALPEEADLTEYTEEERLDATTQYLTKDEFRKLPTIEKNQRALERYWKRPKSKWLIGRIYERYVGHLYEKQGYEVDYVGIFKGFEDLGRDLICKKGDEIIVIQCKNWSQFKTIFEKHIFQFFGTVFQYKDENKGKDVKAVFYSATKLSDLARRFADELGIGLEENFKMNNGYPCIKCNISGSTKEKIYHLPFDQQYDKVKIEPHKGEFYCTTIKEAEDAGFRRAFRHKFNKGS